MAKFCEKCGTKLDENTGLCPRCSIEQLQSQSEKPLSKKEAKRKRKEEKGVAKERTIGQKVRGFLLKLMAMVLAVFILTSLGVGALVYFNVIEIPFVSKVLKEIGLLEDDIASLLNKRECIFGTFTNTLVTDEDSALEVIEEAKNILGINNVQEELIEQSKEVVLNNSYYRFEQQYQGIPVYGRGLTISADQDGNCLLITGNYENFGDIETEIKFEESIAIETALRHFGTNAYIESEGLMIYSLGDFTPEIAWLLHIRSNTFEGKCFISALSGKIMNEISDVYTDRVIGTGDDIDGNSQSFNTEKDGNLYTMQDTARNIIIYDAKKGNLEVDKIIKDSAGKIYTIEIYEKIDAKGDSVVDRRWVDEDGNEVVISGENYQFEIKNLEGKVIGTKAEYQVRLTTDSIFKNLEKVTSKKNVWDDKKAVTLMSRISQIYDFWDSQYQRKGFNGTKGKLVCVYDDHMDGSTGNAYSWGSKDIPISVVVFQTDNLLAYDWIGHEYMHSVERSISNMNYQGESGALMEAYSDVFGEIIEDWCDDGVRNASCDWSFGTSRNLEKPNESSLPDKYYGKNWVNTLDVSKENDYGGVHTNNTVISHAAYLMWSGIGEGESYDSLSMKNLSDLFYSTLPYLPKDCTFKQFGIFLLSNASVLCEQNVLTYKQYLCVEEALRLVGIEELVMAPEFMLSVFDEKGEYCNNYTLIVEKVVFENQKQGPDIESDTTLLYKTKINTKEAQRISLDPGTYKLTVSEDIGNNEEKYRYITVIPHGKEDLSILTSFQNDNGYVSEEKEQIKVNSDEREIVLVLDVSGSMSGTPLEETKNASSKFVKTILEEDASIGIVTYDNSAYRNSEFSTDKNLLLRKVSEINGGGGTNIESGLAEAYSMLKKSNAKKKIVVLMSDGEPNYGKEGDELIAYADELKKDDIIIYTLGFFENLGGYKSDAQYLMEGIASDGCHYEVASADDLVFFFEDMADQINGQKYIYIRIACPVDVSVTYAGETLNSSVEHLNERTDFGTLTFEQNKDGSEDVDDRVKILRLKEGVDYDVEIVGTGRGIMDYTIGFMDDEGDYTDLRKFENIRITRRTQIDTVAKVSEESILNIDEDGDGEYDLKLRAEKNGYGEEVKIPPWVIWAIAGAGTMIFIDIIIIIILRVNKRKRDK